MGISAASAGSPGCPCVNSTGTLASLADRRCPLPRADGGVGIQLTVGGSCVPFSYGAGRCLQHDLLHDPICRVDDAGERVVPDYCFHPWCYVDLAACRRSDQRVYRSSYFPADAGADLFYSYSTCNSTADDWFAVEDDIAGGDALGGVSIDANVPTYIIPLMYKRDKGSGKVLSAPGSEFYEDTVPYEGVYIDYAKRIMKISNGDIRNITFTHRSSGSVKVHPASSFTAAVQDVQDGLADMAVGPFWITSQRLRMTSFTIPIVYDKTVLVIPRPGMAKDTLAGNIGKVFEPFDPELWGVVVGVIAFASLLSVWYADRTNPKLDHSDSTDRRMGLQRRMQRTRRRKRAYARLALDACLQKGLFFCSAGVEQDEHATLPTKILLFGFGLFILVSVSAYVANLAAFLTLSTTEESVRTMQGAVDADYTICAHPAIQAEIEIAWEGAKFYFHEEGREFPGVLDDYLAGKCDVMAIGYEDTSMDQAFLEKLCANNLVFTKSLVVEIPMAFPIRSSLASGFSYHMFQGERYHETSIQTSKNEFQKDPPCPVHLTKEGTGMNHGEKIGVGNFAFPILFFSTCVVVSVIVQIFHLRKVETHRESLVGRPSEMNLKSITDEPQRGRRKMKSLGPQNSLAVSQAGEATEVYKTDSWEEYMETLFEDEEKEEEA